MKKSFLIICLILAACSKKDTEIPAGVLSKDQMVRVLIDIHLLESKVKKLNLKVDSSQAVYRHYEQLLLEDLEISREQYDRSLEFYVDEIELLKDIYEEVSDSLLARTKSEKFD